ncbi:DUF1707 domain-containing protein [Streptomyces sp. NPDC047981]|uniref:DUF1707 SHOCT-like domain-containing protein n=1 Tax=Streptomyces sp. NPDC047981 TaxID=3154610 RepID=UPI003420DE0D
MTAQPPEPIRPAVPPGQLRASHDDREAVVERLRDAAAEGRLDFDELDERLGLALTAKTHAELAVLTADLPAPESASASAAAGSLPPLLLKGGLNGASRGPGRWEVPARVIARGGLGGVKIDFSRVECRLPEVEVEAYGEAAGVTVIVPDGWAVDTGGMDPGIGGLKDRTTGDRLPGTPLIRLTGSGGMAGVVVRHPNRRERRKLESNPKGR